MNISTAFGVAQHMKVHVCRADLHCSEFLALLKVTTEEISFSEVFIL